MNLRKSETNNAIVVELSNVRPHPNADRLKLATVLGTQVVVGIESKDGDVVVYFDSNLRLSNNYLTSNNLYSNPEMNIDPTKKGYFGKNGKVKSQKFRGETSNGFVAPIESILLAMGIDENMKVKFDTSCFQIGAEFTHVNDVKICEKYVIQSSEPGKPGSRKRTRKSKCPTSGMFKQHWDTKQLMREIGKIPSGKLWVEEKIHGTSGRTGNLLCMMNRPWWKFWVPKEEWRIISGTRRVDHISSHMSGERLEVERMLAPNLRNGETVYYEIFGNSKSGKAVQNGFTYGCGPTEYKVMLYRVTITTVDGFTVDLPREMVYRRADELGLMKPILIDVVNYSSEDDWLCNGGCDSEELEWEAKNHYVCGNSAIANHIKEGIVVWFQRLDGTWDCLKYKSDEFLMMESKQRDEEIGDVEDSL